MIDNISTTHPIARKVHICNLCGCVIPKGEKYQRQTNVFDGHIYDFVCHCDCDEVASQLNMYSDCDYDGGLTSEFFTETIDQYVYDNHYDSEKDDTADEWQGEPYIGIVRMILNELKTKDYERNKAIGASTPHDATCNRL